MGTISITASRVFTVDRRFGKNLEGALRENLKTKFTKGGAFANLLTDTANGHPNAKGSIADQVRPFISEANKTLESAFQFIEATLTEGDNLPRAWNVGSKSHRFNMQLLGGNKVFDTPMWEGLSNSYTDKLRSMARAGHRKGSVTDKRFWLERPDHKNPDNLANSLSAMVVAEFDSGLITDEQALSDSDILSQKGKPYTVSYRLEKGQSSFFASVRTHYRATKKSGKTVIGRAKGEFLLPTGVAMGMGSNAKTFSQYVYDAVEGSGAVGSTALMGEHFGLAGNTPPDLLQLILINEYRRPFIGKAFKITGEMAIANLQKLALRQK